MFPLRKWLEKIVSRKFHVKAGRRHRHRAQLLLETLEGRALPSVSGVNITSITAPSDSDGNLIDEHVSVTAGTTITVNFDYTTGGGTANTNQHAEIWNTSFTGSALATGFTKSQDDADGAHSGSVTVDTTGLVVGNYGIKVLLNHQGNGTDFDPNTGAPNSGLTILTATVTVTPSVSLSAPDKIYNGSPFAGASASSIPDVSGFGSTNIKDYATFADATADTNVISAPTNVGTYYARAFYVSDGLIHGGTIYQNASSSVVTFHITAKHIIGSFTAADKPYDSNNSATVLTTDPGAIVAGDKVGLSITNATFSDKYVGTGKIVTANSYSLTGAAKDNYVLDSVATTTASISALHITGSFTAADKPYDGNNSATVLTTDPGAIVAGDDVGLSITNATFSDKYVGTGKTVTANSYSLTGAAKDNYLLDSVATTTASISALHITGSFTAADKPYDGNNSATVLTTDPGAIVAGDDVGLSITNATFSDKYVGTGKTVTANSYSLTGAAKDNYVLDSVATTTASISALHITGSFTAADKPYDGNNSATVLTTDPGAIVAGDDVGLSITNATFSDKYVGTGKTVTANSYSLTGAAKDNYVLDSVATTTASISALHITGSFTAADKPYDGNNSATVLTTDPGAIVVGDDVGLSITNATFSDKYVGTGKTVTANSYSLTGAAKDNYVLDSVATTTASISARHITGCFTAADKNFDGNNSAKITGRSLHDAVVGDDVCLTGGTATFANSSPGTWIVTGSGFSISGADKDNYVLDTVGTTTASISFPAGDFAVDTQAALNTYKSGDIVASVTATNSADLLALQALASGGYSFRYVLSDAKATVTVAASLVAGSYTGTGDTSFSLTYRNFGATNPLNALVGSANTSASTAMNVTCTAQVLIGGTWYDLGSQALRAFLSKK